MDIVKDQVTTILFWQNYETQTIKRYAVDFFQIKKRVYEEIPDIILFGIVGEIAALKRCSVWKVIAFTLALNPE